MKKSYRVKEVISLGTGRGSIVCGLLLPSAEPISYLGDIDPKSGVLHGNEVLADKILVFPNAVGSTVGSYVIYALRKYNKAPKAMVVNSEDPVTIIASIISEVPLYKLIDCQARSLVSYKGCRACIKEGELIIET